MAWNESILEKLASGECTSLEDQINAAFEIRRLRRALTKIMDSGSYEHRTTLAFWAKEALKGSEI